MTALSFPEWLDSSAKSLIAVALFAAALGLIIALGSLANRLFKLRSRTKNGLHGIGSARGEAARQLDW